jgi:hypothetical protein
MPTRKKAESLPTYVTIVSRNPETLDGLQQYLGFQKANLQGKHVALRMAGDLGAALELARTLVPVRSGHGEAPQRTARV